MCQTLATEKNPLGGSRGTALDRGSKEEAVVAVTVEEVGGKPKVWENDHNNST